MSGHDRNESLTPQYFEDIYERNRDPWSFATSEYENDKYAATLAALPQARYRHALEVGCSIGVLTSLLAQRCDALLGLDVSEQALAAARERCANQPQVTLRNLRVPQQIPDGDFDLILISEVAYYWSVTDLNLAASGLAARQHSGGNLVLVHLTEHVPDYPLTGDQVHDLWLQRPEWKHIAGQRHERFRIDVLERVSDPHR